MTRDEILAKVAKGELPIGDASKLLDALAPQNNGKLYCKVSEKKALSLYGLQRMPVTLYKEQWDRLFAFVDEVKAFRAAHDLELSSKADKVAATEAARVAVKA